MVRCLIPHEPGVSEMMSYQHYKVTKTVYNTPFKLLNRVVDTRVAVYVTTYKKSKKQKRVQLSVRLCTRLGLNERFSGGMDTPLLPVWLHTKYAHLGRDLGTNT